MIVYFIGVVVLFIYVSTESDKIRDKNKIKNKIKMKKVVLLLLLISGVVFSQVGIGTNTPDGESILDIKTEGGDKAVGLPFVSLESLIDNSVNPIKNPKEGFFVYNTNSNLTEDGVTYGKGLYYHDGVQWQAVSFENRGNLTEAFVENIRYEDPNGDYPDILTNYTEILDNIEGGSFNPVSGEFTVPKDSIYELNYSSSILALSSCIIGIRVNGVQVTNILVTASVNLQTVSSSIALDLKQGDTLDVIINPLQAYDLDNRPIVVQEFKVQLRL